MAAAPFPLTPSTRRSYRSMIEENMPPVASPSKKSKSTGNSRLTPEEKQAVKSSLVEIKEDDSFGAHDDEDSLTLVFRDTTRYQDAEGEKELKDLVAANIAMCSATPKGKEPKKLHIRCKVMQSWPLVKVINEYFPFIDYNFVNAFDTLNFIYTPSTSTVPRALALFMAVEVRFALVVRLGSSKSSLFHVFAKKDTAASCYSFPAIFLQENEPITTAITQYMRDLCRITVPQKKKTKNYTCANGNTSKNAIKIVAHPSPPGLFHSFYMLVVNNLTVNPVALQEAINHGKHSTLKPAGMPVCSFGMAACINDEYRSDVACELEKHGTLLPLEKNHLTGVLDNYSASIADQMLSKGGFLLKPEDVEPPFTLESFSPP